MNDSMGFFRGHWYSKQSRRFGFDRRAAVGLPVLVSLVILLVLGINSPLIGQTVNLESASASPAANDAARPSAKPKRKIQIQNQGYVDHEHQVDISGHVRNESGNPVAGARVFVIPIIQEGLIEEFGPVAEGQTDEDGRYNFNNVTLNVRQWHTTFFAVRCFSTGW